MWMSHSVMPLQRARLSEGDTADVAREGLFARVAPLVHDEVGAFVEDFVAASELADVESPLALRDLVPREDALASGGIDLHTQVPAERLIVLGAILELVHVIFAVLVFIIDLEILILLSALGLHRID